MTYGNDFTLPAELMEQVQAQGLDVLPELIRIVINAAMQAERSEHVQAAPYEHNQERRGYANGFKPKTMRSGWVTSPLRFHRSGQVGSTRKR